MFRNYLYIFIAVIFFGIGAYIWKIENTGVYLSDDFEADYPSQLVDSSKLVVVGDQSITLEDINWEYKLLTYGLINDEELTSIPEVSDLENQLNPLKEKITAYLVERKLLFKFIQLDQDFTINEVSRYTSCLQEWQKTIAEDNEIFQTKQDRDRLKNRLCERQIILQYMEEEIFAKIKIPYDDIVRYYQDHQDQFVTPPRVLIRQIVLASESEAKRIRHRVRRHNFESIAREVSISPEAAEGGLMGPFAKGDMPRIFDVAFGMRRGEIRGILKSTYGFHIIKLEKKFPESKLSLDEAQERIQAILTKKQQEEEYQKWVELALSAVQVKSPKSM